MSGVVAEEKLSALVACVSGSYLTFMYPFTITVLAVPCSPISRTAFSCRPKKATVFNLQSKKLCKKQNASNFRPHSSLQQTNPLQRVCKKYAWQLTETFSAVCRLGNDKITLSTLGHWAIENLKIDYMFLFVSERTQTDLLHHSVHQIIHPDVVDVRDQYRQIFGSRILGVVVGGHAIGPVFPLTSFADQILEHCVPAVCRKNIESVRKKVALIYSQQLTIRSDYSN